MDSNNEKYNDNKPCKKYQTNKSCIKLIRRYKRICNSIIDDVECYDDQIKNMNREELQNLRTNISTKYHSATECYNLREEYKKCCIDPQYWDDNHDLAIDINKKISKICKNSLIQIAYRFQELDDLDKLNNQNLQNQINGITLNDSQSKPDSKSLQINKKNSQKNQNENKKNQKDKTNEDEDIELYLNTSIQIIEEFKKQQEIEEKKIDELIIDLRNLFFKKINDYNLLKDKSSLKNQISSNLHFLQLYVIYYLNNLNLNLKDITSTQLSNVKNNFIDNPISKLDLVKIITRVRKSWYFLWRYNFEEKKLYLKPEEIYDVVFFNIKYNDKIYPIIMDSRISIPKFINILQFMIQDMRRILSSSKLKFNNESNQNSFNHEQVLELSIESDYTIETLWRKYFKDSKNLQLFSKNKLIIDDLKEFYDLKTEWNDKSEYKQYMNNYIKYKLSKSLEFLYMKSSSAVYLNTRNNSRTIKLGDQVLIIEDEAEDPEFNSIEKYSIFVQKYKQEISHSML